MKMKMSLIAKDYFIRKISIHLLLFHNPFNELFSLCMVSRLQFLSQLHFVRLRFKFRENNCREPLEILDPGVELMFLDSEYTLTNCFDVLCWTICWRTARVLRSLIYPAYLIFLISILTVDDIKALFRQYFVRKLRTVNDKPSLFLKYCSTMKNTLFFRVVLHF